MTDYSYLETVSVFKQERFDGEWLPESLEEAIKWLQDKHDEVPEEYRSSATVNVESIGSYEDSHYPMISIEYERPPTQEEGAARKEAARARLLQEATWIAQRAVAAQAALQRLNNEP